MALLSIFFDCKYKTFYAKLISLEGKILSVNKSAGGESEKKPNFYKRIFMLLYKMCEIHVILNLVSVIALFNIFLKRVDFLGLSISLPALFFFFYSFLLPFVFIARMIYVLRNNQVDKDFNSAFSVLENERSPAGVHNEN